MGFAEYSHQVAQSSGSESHGLSLLYNLTINKNVNSPEDSFIDERSREIYGQSEIVWFLNYLEKTPIYKYHKVGDTRDRILCAKIFPQIDTCPACVAYEHYRELYGDQSDRKTWPVQAMKQSIIIPVFVPRRIREPHLHRSKTSVSHVTPIYWWEMECTNYSWSNTTSNVYWENFERMRKVNNTASIGVYPYKVFGTQKVEQQKREWYFKPEEYNPTTMSLEGVDHPLITDWINKATLQKLWTPEYFDMFEYLPMLSFKQYVDPQTQETFDYAGEYAKALQYNELIKQSWPKAAKRVQQQAPQQQQYQPPAGVAYPQQPYQHGIPF